MALTKQQTKWLLMTVKDANYNSKYSRDLSTHMHSVSMEICQPFQTKQLFVTIQTRIHGISFVTDCFPTNSSVFLAMHKYSILPRTFDFQTVRYSSQIAGSRKSLGNCTTKACHCYILLEVILSFQLSTAFKLRIHEIPFLNEHIRSTDLISWGQAYGMCKTMGGSLPLQTQRRELEEIVALIRITNQLPPLEAIYIGLYKTSEVQN